jgi:hypothetical protein
MIDRATFLINPQDANMLQDTIENLKQLHELDVLARNLVSRSYKLMDGRIIINDEALKELAEHLGLELTTVPF